MENPEFWYKEFDVRHLLPNDWQEQVISTTTRFYFSKKLIPTSVTSKESKDVPYIDVCTVSGNKIRENLPWLSNLYESEFLEIGRKCVQERVHIARDSRYALNLNYQYGTKMRYECHVDSNPLEGLLYITDHPKGSGGELVVGLDTNAGSVEQVDAKCIEIYPKAGFLVFFDARKFPHYVRSLKNDSDFRIVLAMNFYTDSCTEENRPDDLNKHLGIE